MIGATHRETTAVQRQRDRRAPTRRASRRETTPLREDMLASFLRGEVCSATEIFERVRGRWGDVGDARLHGILHWLRGRGLVEYTGEGYRVTDLGRAVRSTAASSAGDPDLLPRRPGDGGHRVHAVHSTPRPTPDRELDPELDPDLLSRVATALLGDLGHDDPSVRVDCRVLLRLCAHGRAGRAESYVHQVWSLVLRSAIHRATSGGASPTLVAALSQIPVEATP